MAAVRPVLPEGFAAPRVRRFYFSYSGDESFPPPNQYTSLLEWNLRELQNVSPPAGRVYFAITERAPATVPVGVKGARQEAGFHVIKGNW